MIKETQHDKSKQAEVKTFYAATNGERRLEMAVRTKPFGNIIIWQHESKCVWDFNFTERILMSSECK